jgi:hypothetical protein
LTPRTIPSSYVAAIDFGVANGLNRSYPMSSMGYILTSKEPQRAELAENENPVTYMLSVAYELDKMVEAAGIEAPLDFV